MKLTKGNKNMFECPICNKIFSEYKEIIILNGPWNVCKYCHRVIEKRREVE